MGPVGIVGLGAMGLRMASALGEVRPVLAYDVRPDAVAQATARTGVAGAGSVAEVAAGTPVVLLSLPTAGAVRGLLGDLVATDLVLDTSTIGPADTRAFAEVLAPSDTVYLDAPVLGRPASVGGWTIPVGGRAEQVARARAVLAPLAARVVPVGPVGAATTIKVLNNTMLGAINAVTGEMLALAAAAGIDPGVFVDTVIDSGAASVSGLFKDVAPRAVAGDFDPVFTLALMLKDVRLGVELAVRCGLDLPVARAAERSHADAVAAGHGEEDSIAVVRLLEERSGLSVRRR